VAHVPLSWVTNGQHLPNVDVGLRQRAHLMNSTDVQG